MDNGGYFDHNATTPLDPRVREAMLAWMGERWGNPSSVHRFGRAAREAVEQARDRVAALIGGAPLEIVFTATGTEAANAVVASSLRGDAASSHAVASTLEHPAIRESLVRSERSGARLSWVEPTADGQVEAAAVEEALEDDSALVCLMLAHNELGTLQPVAEVGRVCRARGVPLLTDAVQAAGKVPIRVEELEVDFLIVAGHKFHGPLGAAALWIRGDRDLDAYLVGGGQERRRRAGTLDVPAIVGLGKACELAELDLAERRAHLRALRDRFEAGLAEIPGSVVHCAEVERLPNTSHVHFTGLDASELVIRLDLRGFAVSTGSACSSGATEVNLVLAAIGLGAAEAKGSLRFSFGMPNTEDEVDALLGALADEVGALRAA